MGSVSPSVVTPLFGSKRLILVRMGWLHLQRGLPGFLRLQFPSITGMCPDNTPIRNRGLHPPHPETRFTGPSGCR